MRVLLVTALSVCLVSADVGLGYNYKVPHTSYGVPSYQIGGSSVDYNTGNNGNSAWQNNYKEQILQGNNYNQQNSGIQGFQTADRFGSSNTGASYQNPQVGQYYVGGSNSGSSSFVRPSYQFNGGNVQGGYQGFNHQYQTSSQYQTSAVEKYQQYYNQLQHQPPQIYKHFYVHAAPEEPEPKRTQPITLPPPQKHYKIIFIKAPTQPAVAPQFIPVPQQTEEKTIVYVLVKNPEEQPEIQLPKIEPKPPAKPEVFFIKYNNKDDKSVINNIVSDYNKVDSVNFGSDGTGQYLGSQPEALGQFLQTTGSAGQSSSSSQNLQATNLGSYNDASSANFEPAGQQFSSSSGSVVSSTGDFGTSNLGSQSTQGLQSSNVVSQIENQASFGSVDSLSNAGHNFNGDDSFSSANAGSGVGGSSATASASSLNIGNLVSSSQQVPHETYGPPKFRNF